MSAALTVLVPELDFKVTAQKLETMDLELQILKADQLLTDKVGPWEGYWGTLAAYALVLLRELRGRGFDVKNPELVKRLTRALSGAHDTLPEWLPKFVENHKHFLSCQGWVQYLRDRGLSDKIVMKYRDKTLLQLISETRCLMRLFEDFEDTCNRAKFGRKKREGVTRKYSEYDPPALLSLCP